MLSKSTKNIISNQHFHRTIGKTVRILEKFWLVLYLKSSGHTERRFSSTVSVENCICGELLPTLRNRCPSECVINWDVMVFFYGRYVMSFKINRAWILHILVYTLQNNVIFPSETKSYDNFLLSAEYLLMVSNLFIKHFPGKRNVDHNNKLLRSILFVQIEVRFKKIALGLPSFRGTLHL